MMRPMMSAAVLGALVAGCAWYAATGSARTVAAAELPAIQAQANVANLRETLAQYKESRSRTGSRAPAASKRKLSANAD